MALDLRGFVLVPRASWRPEYEDQEAVGRDTGFKVLDFRTSGLFWFSTTFLIVFTCSCRSVNDCKFRWFKAFKRESFSLLLNQRWPKVLKSRTSNPVSPRVPRATWPSHSIFQEALQTRSRMTEILLNEAKRDWKWVLCKLDIKERTWHP